MIKWSQQPSIRQKWPELALLHHIPNGRQPGSGGGKASQGPGREAGRADLCLPVARGPYHGLYIEMKAETGTASPEQKWWGEQLLAQGNMWEVCHGWRSAVRVLEWYLTLSGRP